MLRDKKDRMWVGTFGGGLNLAVPDEAGDGYHFRRFFTDTYSQRQIRVICEEPNGYLWVGSSAGIFIFHPDSLLQDPQNYVAYNIDNGALRSNEIKCMLRDSKGRMWLGTSGKGFSMCRPEGNYKDLGTESCGLLQNWGFPALILTVIHSRISSFHLISWEMLTAKTVVQWLMMGHYCLDRTTGWWL